ncbi:carboxymethylenebutenolidase KNAG_0A05820 [Huiozyma naganishii CBS 8797]|uniref:Dienelactone hydrolase domain-containing protein n=1 Tax=Huiozyma naganishii (strain ATCC MYA-139 / BCRC 22969 / CBS 8797 / KCTC 17520 / NBRC 10181 / NCYC 3082 / Yp74L-3) TaxID=1071383 RepID=J7R0B8_HUIN7|nr:hypothetical protein KNAG_0A05820 [Kazachstania naganishii CBS 8797]CCK68245.1 hypothetical protein KNAG_0A05820 [Kazachstania naganishii CBS 8797]
MLIEETFEDVPTSCGQTPMRCYIFTPKVANYPQAKFPGVIVYSEIYQVTGPVRRFAQRIASQGYVVIAPAIYHNFVGPEAMPYDVKGTDDGNQYKIEKSLSSYDEDNKLCCDLLYRLPQFDGARIGVTGMCLGGHLAFRALLDKRISCATCFFPTDIHSKTLGLGKNDDSLERVSKELTRDQEMILIFGTLDTHVPPEGRDLIRKTLRDNNCRVTFLEVLEAQHAFIRDESSKGRYDAAITEGCLGLMLEQFNRSLKTTLGPFVDNTKPSVHVC